MVYMTSERRPPYVLVCDKSPHHSEEDTSCDSCPPCPKQLTKDAEHSASEEDTSCDSCPPSPKQLTKHAEHSASEEDTSCDSCPPSPKRLKVDQGGCSSNDTDPSLLDFKTVTLNNTAVHYCKTHTGLNIDYFHRLFGKKDADNIFKHLEKQLVVYLDQSENKVLVYGKTHKIPRKQAAFGDSGLTYSFSGVTINAHPWLPLLYSLKECVESVLHDETFNFVLVNRYNDGSDHISEHRDDERDLVPGASIAGLSFGQSRDFVLKHKDSRGKNAKRKDIQPVKINLGHGSLLVMKHPTNCDWYHSVPSRKSAAGVRISLTFRRLRV